MGFRELLAPQAHTFSRGEGAPGGGGCGIREITCDTVLRKDLRMGYALGGLIRLPCRCVSARIPHQSAARSSPADSFSPGEAIAARCAAVAPEGQHIPSSNSSINWYLKHARKKPSSVEGGFRLCFYRGDFLILAKARGYWGGVKPTLRSTITVWVAPSMSKSKVFSSCRPSFLMAFFASASSS